MNNDILAILGDLTNGAMNYYKNPKVIELSDIENIIYTLQQELDQYKNNWEELKKYCEFQNNKLCKDPLKNQKSLSIVNWVLNKMKELEEGK